MTVHYGYNYKKDLIKKMRLHYAKELDALHLAQQHQAQLDVAQALILEFFRDVKEEFQELALASGGKVQYSENENGFFLKMKIHEASIQFSRIEAAIEIEITQLNSEDEYAESRVVAYVIPGDKKCRLKRVGKAHDGLSFDESAINSYVRQAFSHLLDHQE